MSLSKNRHAVIAFDCLFPNQTGGGERVYQSLAQELSHRGIRVEYLTREHEETARQPFKVTPIWLGEIYDAQGKRRALPALHFASALYRKLRKRRDTELVIVSATPVFNVFAARCALVGAKASLYVDWLEIWPWQKWRQYSGFIVGTVAYVLQNFALLLTTNATANSQDTLDRMPRRLRDSEPILLGLNGLSAAPIPRLDASSEGPIILFVGRLIADKRAETIPEALSVVRKVYPNARAVIVGDGPERQNIETAAHEANMMEYVQFTGRIDDDELDEWFRRANVLINPSEREGFGLVIVEAAARATPSVVVPGPNNAAAKLIEHKRNGFLAKSHTPTDLANALVQAIDGGIQLRESTLEWAIAQRSDNNISTSVTTLLSRLRSVKNGT